MHLIHIDGKQEEKCPFITFVVHGKTKLQLVVTSNLNIVVTRLNYFSYFLLYFMCFLFFVSEDRELQTHPFCCI